MPLKVKPARPARLPDGVRLAFRVERGMPAVWQTWVRDLTYWHGSLEEG
jgi:hypothetical protein